MLDVVSSTEASRPGALAEVRKEFRLVVEVPLTDRALEPSLGHRWTVPCETTITLAHCPSWIRWLGRSTRWVRRWVVCTGVMRATCCTLGSVEIQATHEARLKPAAA